MKRLYGTIRTISKTVAVISYAGVFFAMLFTTYDIMMRSLINKPLLGAYEITELTMACIVFASFAYTQTEKGHVNVVMFLRMMPPKLRFIAYTFTNFLSAFISLLITAGAFRQAMICYAQNYVTANRGIPYAPFYIIAGIGMALFTVTLFLDSVYSLTAIFHKQRAAEIEAGWI